MKLIEVTRRLDEKKMYINPKNICAIFPHFREGYTVIQFQYGDRCLGVVESLETVAAKIERSEDVGKSDTDSNR